MDVDQENVQPQVCASKSDEREQFEQILRRLASSVLKWSVDATDSLPWRQLLLDRHICNGDDDLGVETSGRMCTGYVMTRLWDILSVT